MIRNFRVDQDFLYSTTDDIDILQYFRNAMAANNKNFSGMWKFNLPLINKRLTKIFDAIRAINEN